MASKSPPPASPAANEQGASIALREAALLMQPIAQWLLRNGVPYRAFTDMLKSVFVAAAQHELERSGTKATHSALSVLSGVHRKDVRALALADPQADAPRHSISLASQVFTRWLSDSRFRERGGALRTLARSGPGLTFESLARELSSDVHPRTVLEELIRLGLVTLEGDLVVPSAQAFVPSRQLEDLTALFAANAADHLNAAVHNLAADTPKFLEQSIFASGMSEASVEHLHQTARALWAGAFESMMNEGRQRIAADDDVATPFRMRFGVYYFSEPAAVHPGAGSAARPSRASRPTRVAGAGKALGPSAIGTATAATTGVKAARGVRTRATPGGGAAGVAAKASRKRKVS